MAARANVDVQDRDGWTALHWTAYQGRAEVTSQLLAARAKVDLQTKDGRTTLHWAAGGQCADASSFISFKLGFS